MAFEQTVGRAIDMLVLTKIPVRVAKQFPLNYFFDHDGDDLFKYKETRKMRLVFALILLIIFIFV